MISKFWRVAKINAKRFRMGFKTYPHRRPYDPEQKHIVNGVVDNEWLNSHRPYLNVWSRQPQPYMYDQEKADWIPKSLEGQRYD